MPWPHKWTKSKTEERTGSGDETSFSAQAQEVYVADKAKHEDEHPSDVTAGIHMGPIPSEETLRPIVPETPAAVYEAYEAASGPPSTPATPAKAPKHAPLSDAELKYIFSGAPHFILEKGARSQWHPHALFPWDESSSIQNLRDRRPIYRPAFALATLHAHLPVFMEQKGTYQHPGERRNSMKSKLPTCDFGVFEIPNMLSSRAKESGCVGYHYFLESGIAQAYASERPVAYPGRASGTHKRATGTTTTAAGFVKTNEPYADCDPSLRLERLEIIREGADAWQRLGIRDCTVATIAQRIQFLQETRDKIVYEGNPPSFLDVESEETLSRGLFNTFLFPAPFGAGFRRASGDCSLKTQIDVLLRVLTVRGAWIDFSNVEWRLRVAQVLWESTPHQDGDSIEHPTDESGPGAAAERKWLLLQILLTTELFLRIDAAVKSGFSGGSRNKVHITPHEIHHLTTLRTEKLDWDVICCRRILDSLTFKCVPPQSGSSSPGSPQRQHMAEHMAERVKERLHFHKSSKRRMTQSAWDCIALPRFPYQQYDGVTFFAEAMDWPNLDDFKCRLKSKLDDAKSTHASMAREFCTPLTTAPLPPEHKRLDRNDMYRQRRSLRLVQLQMPQAEEPGSEQAPSPSPSPSPSRAPARSPARSPAFGGWMSRAMMCGLVLPGDAINGLVMATILENDPEAMRALGPVANLYGGFVYSGRSWWSRMTIVARVMSCLEGEKTCVEWISCPTVPLDRSGQPYRDTWFEIEAKRDPKSNETPRIHQGTRVFLDSSPLGEGGEFTPSTFSLPLDEEGQSPHLGITFDNITLSEMDSKSRNETNALLPRRATASTTYHVTPPEGGASKPVTFPLRYSIQFISSYTCLPPPGRTTRYTQQTATTTYPRYRTLFEAPFVGGDLSAAVSHCDPKSDGGKRRRILRIPGHPLHVASYPYSYIPLTSLARMNSVPAPPEPDTSSSTSSGSPTTAKRPTPSRNSSWSGVGPHKRPQRRKHTFIIDARGSKDKESFARAWCASVGANAVVGRLGRTCLACSIREARAVDVSIVIRVGAYQ